VVAARQCVTPQMVSKWRARFVEHRLDGLLDAPRSGAPRTIDDARVDAVIGKTLESVPCGATHWSTRTMASATGFSQTAVSRIWRAFGLPPASPGDIQAVHRSDVRRKGVRHRRPLHGRRTDGVSIAGCSYMARLEFDASFGTSPVSGWQSRLDDE
jgi:transposase